MVIKGRAVDRLSSVQLSPLETAYLADGVPRTVGAALAGLAQKGLIAFRDDRKVVAGAPAATSPTDPIEQSVLHIVSKAAIPRSVEDIRTQAEPATKPVRDALRASGLLLSERAEWIVGSAIVLGCFTAYIVCVVLLSEANGGPTAVSVIGGLIITAATMQFLVNRIRLTRRGHAVLYRLRREKVALRESAERAPALLTPTDLAQAVAIYGPAILEGGALNNIGQALKRERDSCGACGGCGGCAGCACG